MEFFFILSGFLFYLTFNPQKILIDFMLGKIARFSPLILFGALLYLPDNNAFVSAHKAVMFPVLFAVIIGFGIFAHYAVEKPGSRFLKKLFFEK